MVERLGLTMRVVRAPQGEVRDALAQDWHAFVASVLPEVQVVPVPNLGEERTVAFARALALDGVILSGGNDLEETPIRD